MKLFYKVHPAHPRRMGNLHRQALWLRVYNPPSRFCPWIGFLQPLPNCLPPQNRARLSKARSTDSLPAPEPQPRHKKKPTAQGDWFPGWVGGIRTHACGSQSPVPYRLATTQYRKKRTRDEFAFSKSGVARGIRTLGLQSHNLAR